jgi:hypothetical protein
MRKHRKMWMGLSLVLAYAAFVVPARADLTGEFAKFQYCPWTDPEVTRCIYSTTVGGEIVLGSRVVPIENPVLIQAGIGDSNPETRFSHFFAASNGVTMARVPQNVPGGLLGIVSSPSASPIVQMLTAILFENDLVGLRATMELARPAGQVAINTYNMSQKEGVSLRLPVKIHLESPLLGPSCFVGSASQPVTWKLTDGKTNPPAPNKPVVGNLGNSEFLAEGLIAQFAENKLVDNSWAAPQASGCGGPLSYLVNPMVNAQLAGAGAGHNTAILENTIEIITSAALKFVEEKNS